MSTSFRRPYNLFGGSSSDLPPGAADSVPVDSSTRSADSFAAAVGSRSRVRPPNAFRTRFFFNSAPSTSNQPTTSTVITAKNGITIEASLYPFTNKDYLSAIKTITGPQQIHSYSRLQGQFSVYFLHPSFASALILNGLNMPGSLFVPCLPVGAPPVRVVVSDVPSHFEPAFLRDIMSTYGRVVGPIKTLRATKIDDDLTHVLSFRRQVMMHFPTPNDRASLPDRVFVTYNDSPLTFFLTTELKCHNCGLPGHVRAVCPDLHQPTPADRHVAPSDPTIIPPDPSRHPDTAAEAAGRPQPEFPSASSAPTDSLAPAAISTPAAPLVTADPPQPLSSVKSSRTTHTAAKAAWSMPLLDMSPITPRPSPEVEALCASLSSATETPPQSTTVPPSGPFKRPNPVDVSNSSAAKKLLLPVASSDSPPAPPSASTSIGDLSECSQDDTMDQSFSTDAATPPINDSSLAYLFNAFNRSTIPLLVHVRTQVPDADIPAFIAYLRHLRKTPVAHQAGPLQHLSAGAIYQWERRLKLELAAETPV